MSCEIYDECWDVFILNISCVGSWNELKNLNCVLMMYC